MGNGRKVDKQAAREGHERRETADEQQPRTVLLFFETRGWLRFVGVVAQETAGEHVRLAHFPRSSVARKKATSIKAFSIMAIRPRSLICDFYFV